MINRLINMEISPINMRSNDNTIEKHVQSGKFTIEQYANAFIEGMSETQKERFKKMLENNIECGLSVAENYGIDYDKFINEVKKQMEVI